MKISIITANYNNEATLKVCFDSVRNQTYGNIEHIIIDGASSDRSMDIIKAYAKLPFVKYFSAKDDGIYDALNKGIKRASGEVIGFLHADDMFASNHTVQNIVAQFQLKQCDGVYGDLHYFKDSSPFNIIRNWVSGPFNKSLLKHGWMPPHPTLYIKSKLYQENGLYKCNYKIAADYDFILCLFRQKDLTFSYVPEVFVKMRMGGTSNRNLKNIIRKSLEDYRILKNNNFKYPLITLTLKNLTKIKQFVT